MKKWVYGDSFDLDIQVTYGASSIEALIFTSEAMKLQKELVKADNSHYILSLTSEEMKVVPSGLSTATYDITAKVKGEKTLTLVYNEEVAILPKDNKIHEWQ